MKKKSMFSSVMIGKYHLMLVKEVNTAPVWLLKSTEYVTLYLPEQVYDSLASWNLKLEKEKKKSKECMKVIVS